VARLSEVYSELKKIAAGVIPDGRKFTFNAIRESFELAIEYQEVILNSVIEETCIVLREGEMRTTQFTP
jgi:hypothetical protein